MLTRLGAAEPRGAATSEPPGDPGAGQKKFERAFDLIASDA